MKRDIFDELMTGVASMKGQREGKITLRSYKVHEVLIRFWRSVHRSGLRRLATAQPRRRFLPCLHGVVSGAVPDAGKMAARTGSRVGPPGRNGDHAAGVGRRIVGIARCRRRRAQRLRHGQHAVALRLGRHAVAHGNPTRSGSVCSRSGDADRIPGRAIDPGRMALAYIAHKRLHFNGPLRDCASLLKRRPRSGKPSPSSSAPSWYSRWPRCWAGRRRPCAT